jgi:hypothetical protein
MLQDFVSPVIDKQFKCNFIFVNMQHRTHISVIIFMIMPQLIINTYVSLMYEHKKNCKRI